MTASSGVYIVKCISTSSIKVGFSTDIKRRVRQIRNMTAGDLQVLFKLEGASKYVEKYLHDFLKSKDKHLHHEWFNFDEETEGFFIGVNAWWERNPDESNRYDREWEDRFNPTISYFHMDKKKFDTRFIQD